MKQVAFVVLHYNVIEVTRQCVDSIQKLPSSISKKIVIVDNGSVNGSGMQLEKDYENDPDICVLIQTENLGFASGNNIGYSYARTKWKADWIIVINNDIIFEQNEFMLELEKNASAWEKESIGVVGPDIVTLSGMHQNPFREKAYELSDVNRTIRNKRIFLIYFYIKKILHLENRIQFLEKMFERTSNARRREINSEECQSGVVLQGACLIFSPVFVKKEEHAFCPDTFLYGEEDLLYFLCETRGYKMLYTPHMKVRHLEGQATKERYTQSVQKNIFVYKHTLHSLNILKKKMKSRVKEGA